MNIGKILGGVVDAAGAVVKVAGPVAGGLAAGGPVGAGLAIAGQLAGAGAKVQGKKMEQRRNGPPVHKAAAPAAAVAAPTALAVLLTQLGVDGADGIASTLCSDSAAMGGVAAGLIAWLSHQLGHNIQSATVRRQ